MLASSRNRIAVPDVATALGLFHQEKGHLSEIYRSHVFPVSALLHHARGREAGGGGWSKEIPLVYANPMGYGRNTLGERAGSIARNRHPALGSDRLQPDGQRIYLRCSFHPGAAQRPGSPAL